MAKSPPSAPCEYGGPQIFSLLPLHWNPAPSLACSQGDYTLRNPLKSWSQSSGHLFSIMDHTARFLRRIKTLGVAWLSGRKCGADGQWDRYRETCPGPRTGSVYTLMFPAFEGREVPMGSSEIPENFSQHPVCRCRQKGASFCLFSMQVVLTDKLSTWMPTSFKLRTDQAALLRGALVSFVC